MQQRRAADGGHGLGAVGGEVAQVAAAAGGKHDGAGGGAPGQVALLGLGQLAGVLQAEDLGHGRDAVLDVAQAALFKHLPRGLLHGGDGAADIVVGPDDQPDAGLLEDFRGRAEIHGGHDD